MALTDNLVSYWKLDESSGNAADSVGSNTLTNTNTATFGAGKINNGTTLARASSQRFLGGTTASLQPASALTFSMWIYVNKSPVSYCAIAGNTLSGNQRGYLFDMNVSGKSLAFQIGNGTWGIVSTTYTVGSWTHIVGTWDGATVRLYKNGTGVGTPVSKASITYTSCGFSLGTYYNDTTSANMFDGMIDEVGIWSRALSATEVTELYNSGNGKQYPFSIQVLISETLALVESITNLRGLQSTISETLGISETWTALKGILFTISETITTSEVWTTTRELVSTVIDTLGLSEIVTLVKKWTNQSKSSSTWSNSTKNTSNWDNQNKS